VERHRVQPFVTPRIGTAAYRNRQFWAI